jgi:hypothetical protein
MDVHLLAVQAVTRVALGLETMMMDPLSHGLRTALPLVLEMLPAVIDQAPVLRVAWDLVLLEHFLVPKPTVSPNSKDSLALAPILMSLVLMAPVLMAPVLMAPVPAFSLRVDQGLGYLPRMLPVPRMGLAPGQSLRFQYHLALSLVLAALVYDRSGNARRPPRLQHHLAQPSLAAPHLALGPKAAQVLNFPEFKRAGLAVPNWAPAQAHGGLMGPPDRVLAPAMCRAPGLRMPQGPALQR